MAVSSGAGDIVLKNREYGDEDLRPRLGTPDEPRRGAEGSALATEKAIQKN
ncbi:hypothetical protein N9L68_00375 [bacterium]|nr:hypothetical protein [bacterium]